MNELLKRIGLREALIGIVGVLLVILYEWPIAFWHFQQDDPKFLQVMHPLQWSDLAAFFRTDWGWVYRPLFLVYFGAMLRWFGPDPVAFHLVSVTLHAMVAALVGVLLLRIVGARRPATGRDRAIAAVSSAVFLVWQGRSEPLQAASCTSTLFAVLFCLISICAWIEWRNTARAVFLVGALAAMVVSLGFKEEAALLPVVLMVLDRFLGADFGRVSTGQRRAAYGAMLLIVAGFAVLSVFSQQSVAAQVALHSRPKIVTVPSAFEPFAVASFYLLLLGNVFSTSVLHSSINVLIFGLICFSVAKEKLIVVGAFWLSVVPCIAVPLTTGSYGLAADRFFYFPRLCLLLAVALLMTQEREFLAALARRAVARPLLASAMIAGWARAGLALLLSAEVITSFEISNAISDFFTDRVFVGLSAATALLAAFAAFRAGRLRVSEFGLVAIIALSNALRWSFPALLLSNAPLAAACLALVAALFYRDRQNPVVGVLCAAALWETSAFSVPLMLVLLWLWRRFAPVFEPANQNKRSTIQPVLNFS